MFKDLADIQARVHVCLDLAVWCGSHIIIDTLRCLVRCQRSQISLSLLLLIGGSHTISYIDILVFLFMLEWSIPCMSMRGRGLNFSVLSTLEALLLVSIVGCLPIKYCNIDMEADLIV